MLQWGEAMSEYSPADSNQNLNISDGAFIERAQIGGLAGHDLNLTQVQCQVAYMNVLDRIENAGMLKEVKVSRAKPLSQKEYRQRKILLNKVRNFWVREVLEKSLHNRVFIELGLESRLNAVERPLNNFQEIPKESSQTIPARILKLFKLLNGLLGE